MTFSVRTLRVVKRKRKRNWNRRNTKSPQQVVAKTYPAFHHEAKSRNWLDLPDCLTLRIFMKLETSHILVAIRHVCSHWRMLSREPILYRSVVFGSHCKFIYPPTGLVQRAHFGRLVMDAVALSCGQMVQFSCDMMSSVAIDHLKHVVSSSVSGLKSLRLGYIGHIDIKADVIAELIKSIPSLEDLHYSHPIILKRSIEEIGRSCPKLRSFTCRTIFSKSNFHAYAIAENMTGLRQLRIHGNNFTDEGLQAILDGCPHLEYIYIVDCLQVNLDFWKKKSASGRIESQRLLKTTDLKECEFHLYTPSDDQQSLSKSLTSHMCQEGGDCGLYHYTAPFGNSSLMGHNSNSDFYDYYVEGFEYVD